MKIECKGLTKKYLTKTAVDHVDLELGGGHIYAEVYAYEAAFRTGKEQ